jgi:hypothetical protein
LSIYPPVATAEGVWSYPTRLLTQTKFPFWSAIITQIEGSVSVPGSSAAYVNIQPPSGEVWLVWIDFTFSGFLGYSSSITYYDYDGTTARIHRGFGQAVTANSNYGYYLSSYGMGVVKILSNTLYARLGYQNSQSSASTGYYGYSGFKLSQPIWSPKRLSDNPGKPWKKPTTLTLPDPIKPLQKYACEMLGLDPARPEEYTLGVILEEDTPLALDPATGFPVERLTVVAKADDLADIISGIKAGMLDPITTGYKKYLDRWASEGIKL